MDAVLHGVCVFFSTL